jgi:hypothetical protein
LAGVKIALATILRERRPRQVPRTAPRSHDELLDELLSRPELSQLARILTDGRAEAGSDSPGGGARRQ